MDEFLLLQAKDRLETINSHLRDPQYYFQRDFFLGMIWDFGMFCFELGKSSQGQDFPLRLDKKC